MKRSLLFISVAAMLSACGGSDGRAGAYFVGYLTKE
ncbi:lipoprotein [Aeromonas sp. QDB33]|nr:lipoprotein [Aeromonas sp. QDB33]